jgi:hypothetical protein
VESKYDVAVWAESCDGLGPSFQSSFLSFGLDKTLLRGAQRKKPARAKLGLGYL